MAAKRVGVAQRSFAGGEITPSAAPRGDLTKYSSGGATVLNWLIARHGAAYNRPGTEFVAEVKDSSVTARIQAFDFNDDDAYIVCFNAQTIRLYTAGAVLLTGAQSDWANSTAYTVGDIVVDGAAGGGTGDYFYCLADHTSVGGTNGPHDAPASIDADVYWHELTNSGSSAILELLTPYADGDVDDLRVTQSGDVMTVTHKSHPPYELVRSGATDWTFLPVRYAPKVNPPTGLTNDAAKGNDAAPSEHGAIYIVTAIKKETLEESLPGAIAAVTDNAGAGTDTGTISQQGVSVDIAVSNTNHDLLDGDEIIVTSVDIVSATESNQWAVEALLNRTFTITATGANEFALNDTAGLLSLPSWYPNPWPSVTIDYRRCRWVPEDSGGDGLRVPTGPGDEIALSWTAPANEEVEEYWVYRAHTPLAGAGAPKALTPEEASEFGFLGATKTTDFTDPGLEPDTEQQPPRHPPPFVSGDYPAVSSYYQQRQVYAGSTNNPRKVWMSRTGDFKNFTTRVPLQDDDSIEFDVQGERVNEVRHVQDNGELMVMTRGAVQIAKGDSDGVIKPSAINLRFQNPHGASTVTPAPVGASVLYADSRRSIIRSTGYSVENDRYAPTDLTAFAAHLFDGHIITNMAFAATPHPILWCVRDDGVLLGLTHLQEQSISAWHRHVTQTNLAGVKTDSIFKSVAVIPESDVDTPYFIVERVIDGSTVQYLERFAPRRAGYSDYDFRADPFFVDCGLSGGAAGSTAVTLRLDIGAGDWTITGEGLTLEATVGTPFVAGDVGNGFRLELSDGTYCEVEVTAFVDTNTVTVKNLTSIPTGLRSVATTIWVQMYDDWSGLDHLEGQTVAVCGDGVDLGTAVVSGGAVTIPGGRPYGYVQIGLPIVADLETLDLDIANQLDSVADLSKRVNGATLYLEDTEGLTAGINSSNLYAIERSHADGTAQVSATTGMVTTSPVTGKRRARFTTTWNRLGRVFMRQSAPLPAAVLGLVVDVEARERKI